MVFVFCVDLQSFSPSIRVVLFWICCFIEESNTTSSAKSRSLSFDVIFHLISFSPCPTVLLITQSITTGPRILTFCILVWCQFYVKPLMYYSLVFNCTLEVIRECSHYSCDLLWDAVLLHNHPQAFTVDRVESLFKVHKFRYSAACYLLTCSVMFRSMKTWSVALPFLLPACSSLSLQLILFLTQSMLILPRMTCWLSLKWSHVQYPVQVLSNSWVTPSKHGTDGSFICAVKPI